MKKNVIGLIPARGGSQRVQKKNIRPLLGKPLIAYTIEAALASRRLNRVIVTTDDEEIAAVSRRWGAELPFLRPEDLAGNRVGDAPVIDHALAWIKENEGVSPDAVAWLRPTTPFKTAGDIDSAVELLFETGAHAVRSVTRVEGVHHPFWMFEKDESQRAQPVVPGIRLEEYYQRQLLPPVFRLNGVVDVLRVPQGLSPVLYGEDIRLMEISEEHSTDIDTERDLAWCEFLMRRRKGNA